MNVTRMQDLPERVSASLPSDDPRYDALRAELAEAQRRGRGSPIPRIVGEYALIGWLFMHGKIGSAPGEFDISELGIANPHEREAQRLAIENEVSSFDFG